MGICFQKFPENLYIVNIYNYKKIESRWILMYNSMVNNGLVSFGGKDYGSLSG